jgi:hypothetical protein
MQENTNTAELKRNTKNYELHKINLYPSGTVHCNVTTVTAELGSDSGFRLNTNWRKHAWSVKKCGYWLRYKKGVLKRE